MLDCLGLLLRWRRRVDVVEGLLVARLHRLELGAVGILGPLRPARLWPIEAFTMRSSTPGEPRLIRGLRRGGTFWPGLGGLADALLPRFWMVLIVSCQQGTSRGQAAVQGGRSSRSTSKRPRPPPPPARPCRMSDIRKQSLFTGVYVCLFTFVYGSSLSGGRVHELGCS